MGSIDKQIKNSNKKQRDSNIELLRLVAITMVVMTHISTWGTFPDVLKETNLLSIEAFNCAIINGFIFVCNNIFFLISGFYGIKLSFKNILNLYLTCVFYGLIGYFMEYFIYNHEISISDVLNHSLLIFSHCPWWFISAYVGLLLLSPILNSAYKSLSTQWNIIVLFLLLFIDVWMGYLWHNKTYDINGYSIIHAVTIYWIGRNLSRINESTFNKHRWGAFATYIGAVGLWTILIFLQQKGHFQYWERFANNNPIVILGAIGIFCFFKSFHFHSKTINQIAPSVIAVYLIHMINTYVPYHIIYPSSKHCIHSLQQLTSNPFVLSIGECIIWLTISILVVIICLAMDSLRKAWLNPLLKFISSQK